MLICTYHTHRAHERTQRTRVHSHTHTRFAPCIRFLCKMHTDLDTQPESGFPCTRFESKLLQHCVMLSILWRVFEISESRCTPWFGTYQSVASNRLRGLLLHRIQLPWKRVRFFVEMSATLDRPGYVINECDATLHHHFLTIGELRTEGNEWELLRTLWTIDV